MMVIGITGGVGAGKTKILEYLQENTDCEIIIADQVANRVKEPGQPCYDSIVELLGKDILGDDGFIDKLKMAARIFQDKSLLKKVNELVHPAVKDFILRGIEEARKENRLKVIFLEAALLIEAGYLPYLDELWYIYVEKEERIRRLEKGRNYSREKSKQIIDCQLSEEEFRKKADVVIDNSGAFAHTIIQLEKQCRIRKIWH